MPYHDPKDEMLFIIVPSVLKVFKGVVSLVSKWFGEFF